MRFGEPTYKNSALSIEEQTSIDEVFGKIIAERKRQKIKLDAGLIPIDLFSETPLVHKLVHILEEAGEVAKEVRRLEQGEWPAKDEDVAALETELVQLATHVVTWRASLCRQ